MLRFRAWGPVFVALLLAVAPMQVWGEPEDLPKAKIRSQMMEQEGPVDEFLKGAVEGMRKNMEEAEKAGRIKKEDPATVQPEITKQMTAILEKVGEFRKTLKEPEHRLKLDLMTVQVAVRAQKAASLIEVINQWKGETREMMILTSAQAMEQGSLPFPPEMDALLQELAKSADETVVAAGKRFLDPFLRDPSGKPFPAFPTGKTTTDGQPLSLERFKGKVLLVDFWATWCPPCRAEVPNLVKAYSAFKDKGFEIVGISFDKKRDELDAYLKEQTMTWPQYFDGKGWDNEVGPTYGIQSIPAMYLLDAEGKVVTTDLRDGRLEKELAKLLK